MNQELPKKKSWRRWPELFFVLFLYFFFWNWTVSSFKEMARRELVFIVLHFSGLAVFIVLLVYGTRIWFKKRFR